MRSAELCLVLGLVVGASVTGISAASAQTVGGGVDVPPVSDAPPGMESVKRGIQAPAGMFHSRILLHINTSKDNVTEPVSLAPDFHYAVTDSFQLGLLHNGPMGLLTRPGAGLCLTGSDEGNCPKVYNNFGLDALWGLAFGDVHFSLRSSLYFFRAFSPMHIMWTIGLAGKLHFGENVALLFEPQLGFGLNERDTTNKDRLFLPLELQFQIVDPLVLKLLSGVTGQLSDMGETYEIPLGLAFVTNISESMDIGLRFSFDNLLGKRPDGVSSTAASSLAVIMNVRFD